MIIILTDGCIGFFWIFWMKSTRIFVFLIVCNMFWYMFGHSGDSTKTDDN